jgi:hypothetical protein
MYMNYTYTTVNSYIASRFVMKGKTDRKGKVNRDGSPWEGDKHEALGVSRHEEAATQSSPNISHLKFRSHLQATDRPST